MSLLRPCPWCGGSRMDWVIPAFSSRVVPMCDDCGAQAPSVTVKSRTDHDAATAAAVSAWNARSYAND